MHCTYIFLIFSFRKHFRLKKSIWYNKIIRLARYGRQIQRLSRLLKLQAKPQEFKEVWTKIYTEKLGTNFQILRTKSRKLLKILNQKSIKITLQECL